MTPSEPQAGEAGEEFAYFMIRVRRDANVWPSTTSALRGVIERLGSGEKREFDEAQELLTLLSRWSDAPFRRVVEGED